MARCKEELRAQGVTALPRTCPEHGLTCPEYITGKLSLKSRVGGIRIAGRAHIPLSEINLLVANARAVGGLSEGVEVYITPSLSGGIRVHWGDVEKATEQRLSRSCDTCRHGELAHDGLGEHQTGCRAIGCECKGYADPYAKLTVLPDPSWQRDESQPVLTPVKNGLQPALPMTFGELRKLVRELDERGVPDNAKITVKGPEGELIDGNVDLRFQWWTVEES